MPSNEAPQEEDGGPILARNCTVDAVVAVILLAVGAVVVFEARRLGAGWTSDGPGAGYFPFYIGLIVCISSVGILCQALFSAARDTGPFVDRLQLKRVMSVLVPAAVYVLATMFLGLYVASAVYIALFMVILGKYSIAKSVAVAVIVNVLFFVMFEVWFKVPLYKGTLEPLRFLGY
jgi:hypothetical protein